MHKREEKRNVNAPEFLLSTPSDVCNNDKPSSGSKRNRK